MSEPAAPPSSASGPSSSGEATRGLVRKVAIATLAGGAVFVTIALWSDLGALRGAVARYPLGHLAAALALAAGNYALRIVRWEMYLRALGIRLRRTDSVLSFLAGFVMSVTPGKLGEVFKSLLLAESHGAPVARTAPIVVAERVTDVTALVVLMALGSLSFPRGIWIAVVAAAGLAVGISALLSRRIAAAFVRAVSRFRVGARIAPRLEEAHDSLQHLSRAHLFVPATLVAVAAWGLECGALHVILLGFGDHPAPLESVFAYSASTMAGAIAMLPGGLGLTEASMTGLLLALRPGLGRAAAGGATILVRLATLWFAVALGAGALALWRLRWRRPRATRS